MWSGSDTNQANDCQASAETVRRKEGSPLSRYAVIKATCCRPAAFVMSKNALFLDSVMGPSVATTSTKTSSGSLGLSSTSKMSGKYRSAGMISPRSSASLLVSPFGNVTRTPLAPEMAPFCRRRILARALFDRFSACHRVISFSSLAPASCGFSKAANEALKAYRGTAEVVGRPARTITAPVRMSPSLNVSSRIGSRVFAAYHLPCTSPAFRKDSCAQVDRDSSSIRIAWVSVIRVT